MFDRVVVAWDGSPPAAGALDWALARAGLRTLHLLLVQEPGEASGRVGAALDGLVARVRAEHPGVAVTAERVVGRPAAVLTARAVPGSLLVLGVRRHGPGLAASVALDGRGPVALVPAGVPRRTGEVIVGVDGSAAAAAATEIAAGEAVDRRTAVVAVHVGRRPGTGRVHLDPVRDPAGGLPARFPHLLVRERYVHGDPAVELARAAATASVLVLGRHEDPDRSSVVGPELVTRVGVPTIVVGRGDAATPLPRFATAGG